MVFDLSGDAFRLDNGEYLNASAQPENPIIGNIFNIVDKASRSALRDEFKEKESLI